MKLLSSIRGFDWLLIAIIFILSLVGFAAIYSVDLSRGEQLIFFPTQLVAFIIGSVVLFLAGSTHMSVYQAYAKWLYLLTIILLVGVLLFGVSVRGTMGWFHIFGFSFQPAELAKVSLVLILGWLVARYGRRFDKPHFLVASGFLCFLFIFFILLQPDLGSALVLFGIWFGIIIMAGTKKRYIGLLVGIFIAVFAVSWFFVFQPYQKERLLTFIEPDRDPLGSGYNVTQSIIAVGSGQFFGRGLGFGSQSQLHFLPEAQTDFIFSVIAEELGFIGVFIVLSLFLLLLWRLVHIARESRSEFGAYVVLGIIFVFLIQLVFNIGGATGLLPITGVTLPFVSQGGSSLIINCFLIGIALSVDSSNFSPVTRGLS
ncbi:rod shape-determining protein RodA [Patescibacteria group bacterium]|nr:rod shape-determining protein RodA [Patescibacteria group bacterium]MBU1895685.1 rod shape-determining protein RodA [Patescibacteria group bacterium]